MFRGGGAAAAAEPPPPSGGARGGGSPPAMKKHQQAAHQIKSIQAPAGMQQQSSQTVEQGSKAAKQECSTSAS